MLKQSENAIGMLMSKYRSVLKKMFVKNAAVLATASCLLFTAAPAMAATYDVGGTGTGIYYETLDKLRKDGVLKNGDTVVVHRSDSSLTEPFFLADKAVTFEFKDGIVIKPDGESRFIITDDSGDITLSGTITLSGKGVVIEKFSDNKTKLLLPPQDIDFLAGGILASTVNITGELTFNNLNSLLTSVQDSVVYNVRGGAIYADNVTIEGNNVFSNNGANTGGSSSFTYGRGYGGVIYATSSVTISGNNRFENNIVSYGGYGGAISAGTVTISGTNTFYGNHANNYAIDYVGATGGAIFAGNVTISDSNVFQSNSASDYGGAIYATGILTISGSNTFDDNAADVYGGAIFSDSGTVNINGSNTFTRNNVDQGIYAYRSGGAIYARDGSINIDGSNNFTNNWTVTNSGHKGGAICGGNSSITVSGSNTFADNYSGQGGAIYSDGGSITINGDSNGGGNHFENNKAANDDGGAVYSEKRLTVSGYNFFNANTAAGSGGALYGNSGNETVTVIDRNSFTGNHAGKDGGAVYNNSSVTIEGLNTFTSNSAEDNGGAVCNWGGTLTFKGAGNSVTSNSAGDSGGALYIASDSGFISGNIAFSGNTAGSNGGAIYAYEDLTITANTGDISFSGNKAANSPNAIYMDNRDSHRNTLSLNASAGKAILFYDPVKTNSKENELNISINQGSSYTGTILFDKYKSDVYGNTTVYNGKMNLTGGATYGADKDNASFTLGDVLKQERLATLCSDAHGNRIQSYSFNFNNNGLFAFDMNGANSTTVNLYLDGEKFSGQAVGAGEIDIISTDMPSEGKYTLVKAENSKNNLLFANTGALSYNGQRGTQNARQLAAMSLTGYDKDKLVLNVGKMNNTTLTWAGKDGNVWNELGAKNWSGKADGQDVTQFLAGDDIIIGYSIGVPRNIVVDGAGVTVGDITFNNPDGDGYSFSGGSISGTNMIGNGTDAITLNNVNKFDSLSINSGHIILNNANNFNSLSINGGTLTVTNPNNTFNRIDFSSGRVNIESNQALGTAVINMSKNYFDVALFDFAGSYSINNDIKIGEGTAVFETVYSTNPAITGSITGDSTSVLEKTGEGPLTVGTTFVKDVNVTMGTLKLAAGKTLTATGKLDVANGATLSITAEETAQVYAYMVDFNESGSLDVNGYNFSNGFPTTTVTLIASDRIISKPNRYTIAGMENDKIDFLSVQINEAQDHGLETIVMDIGLTWYDESIDSDTGKYRGHGTFTLTNPDASFTVGTELTDRPDGNYDHDKWDGKTLTKEGDGTLILTGNNDYTGGTELNAGRIDAGSNTALGDKDESVLIMQGGTTLGFAAEGLSIENKIKLDGSAAVDTAGYNGTLSGTIDGGGGLTKKGEGTLTLDNAANSYTGGTIINQGELVTGKTGALGSGPVQNNAVLTFEGASGNFGNKLSGSGTVNIRNKGAAKSNVTFSENNTAFTGTINLNSGQVNIAADNALGTGGINMSGDTVLGFTNSSSISNSINITGGVKIDVSGENDSGVISGTISGGGGLTKEGDGELILANANTYEGGTNIGVGNLIAKDKNSLGTGTVSIDNDGILILAFDGEFKNQLKSNGELHLNGETDGKIEINRSNSEFKGEVFIDSGRVDIGNNFSLGDGGRLTMKDGTTLGFNDNITLENNITLNNGSATFDTKDNNVKLTGIIDGGGSLTKTGAGTLTLDDSTFAGNPNNYTGGTYINEGTLIAQTSTALGNTSEVKIGQPAALTLEDGGTFDHTLTGGGTLNINGNNLAINNDNTGFTGTAKLASGNTLTIGNNNALGTASLKMGADSVLKFADGYTNYSLGNNITLALGGATVDTGTNDVSLNGSISSLGGLTKKGGGNLTLTFSNTYWGGTIISDGTLTAIIQSALGKGKVDVADGAALNLGFSGTFDNRLSGEGDLNIDSGSGAITFTRANIGFTGDTTLATGSSVNIGNHFALGRGNKLTMEDETSLGFTGSYVLGNDITINGGAAIDVGGGFTGVLIHGVKGGDLTKTGDGTLTLSNSSSLTNITLAKGALDIASGKTLTVTDTAELQEGTTLGVGSNLALTANTVDIGNNVTIDINSYDPGSGTSITLIKADVIKGEFNDVFYIGGVQMKGSDPSINRFVYGATVEKVDGGTEPDKIMFGTGGLVWNHFDHDDAHGTFNIATSFDLKVSLVGRDDIGKNNIFGWDGQTLTKTGAGTLILSGTNTYEGATHINEGILTLKAGDSIASVSQITLGTDKNAATLQLDYDNEGNLNNGVTIAKSGGIIDVAGANVTLTGVIDGAGGLVKNGEGELILDNTNTYNGGTYIAAGTLTAADENALSRGAVYVQEDAALSLAFNGAEFKNVLSGSGALNINGNNITINTTNNNFSGAANIAGGNTLTIGNALALGTGSLTMNDNTTLGFNDSFAFANNITLNTAAAATFDTGNNNAALTGIITGEGGLKKTGGGSLTITNANTYEGGAVISAGTLVAQDANALGTGDVKVEVGDNTLTLEFDGEFKNKLKGSADSTLNIIGKVTVNQNNEYFYGTTRLSSGSTVKIGDSKALGTGDIKLAAFSTLGFTGNNAGYSLDNNIAIAFGGAAVNTAGKNVTLTGEITGLGGLTKEGAGELTLENGNNNYWGGITVSGGTLTATDENALGKGKVEVQSGAELNLIFASTLAGTFDNRLTGGGDLNIYATDEDGTTPGEITFTKANIGFFGDTTIESGRVNIGNYLALGTGGITMNDGTALGFNDSYTLRNKITLSGGSATFDTKDNDVKLTGTIGGDGGLIKDGEGSLTLTNANTYEGGTIIKDGTLIAQNATALGIDYVKISGNTLTLEFDGEFKNELSGTGELNIDGTVTIKTTNDNFAGTTNILSGKTLNIGDDEVLGTSDIKMSASSTLGFNGDYSLGNNINIAFGGAAVNTADNKATLSGKITGLGSLTKEGAGTLTVTGDSTDGINDYQGGTTINGGTLTATDKNALGTGKVEVAKDATLTLKFDGTFANRLTGEGNLNITSNTDAIKFTKINIGFSGNTVLTEGSSVKIDNHLALGTGSLTMEDDTTLGFTGNYLLGNDITIEGAVEIAVDSGVTSTLIHGINSDDTNGSDLTKTGAGTLTLGDDSSLHNVTLEDGTLRIAADKTLTVTDTATLGNGTNDTTLSVGANLTLTAEAVDIANNVTIDINSYNMDDGSGIVLIKADAITGKFNDIFYIGGVEVTTDAPDIEKFIYGTSILYDNDAQGDDTVLLKVVGGLAWNRPEEDSAHGTFNVATSFDLKTNLTDNKNTENYYTDPSGNIWDGKTLTKTGDGTLILSGTNTYEGATNINKGTLTLKADDSILSSSQINLGTDTTSATLQLDYTAAGTLDNDITINENDGTIDVVGAKVMLTGKIDGDGGLTKDGAGELILTNENNNYQGGTYIAAGTLTAAKENAIKGDVEIQNNADLTLAFNGEFANNLKGDGELHINGDVAINHGNSGFKGTTNHISGYTLTIKDTGALGNSGLNIGNSSTLLFKDISSFTNNINLTDGCSWFDTSGSVSLNGIITGGGVLVKTGAGELVLTVTDTNYTNTYTGGTYIKEGTLTAKDTNALGTGAVLNDAALNLQYTGEFKNNLYGDGNLNIDGKIAVKQNNSGFSGITTLNAGSAVQIGNYYALGTGGITMNNETTLGFSGNYFLDNNITLNGTATVNTAGHNAALTGTIGGDGGLTKDGDGELILDKANTYQGGTTIKAGTLTATNVKALGDNENGSVVLVDNDATLNFDLNFRQSGSVDNKITGSGDLVKSGNGILTLTNTGSDYSNLKTVVNDGLLRITADETNQLKLGAVENNAQLNFVSSQNFTEKAITIGTYSGSGTLGLQASITSAEGQWSDYVTFATAPLESVNVHFYFEPGSRLRYMPVAGLPFAPLNADDGNYNKFSLDSAFSMAGVYLLSIKPGEGEYSDDYVLTSVFAPGQAKVYSEVSAATMAQASGMHGRDLLDATSRAAKSASGNNTGIYAGFGRTDARYKTGSHADVDGNTLAVALAWQANEKTAWGIFGQMFDGNYTTSHEGLIRTINSNGKLKAHDVGLFAEYRPAGKSDTGHYYKAIVRAGRSSNDFRADNYQNTISTFQSGRNLFGFSLGGGYVKNSGQDRTIEYYSHLIYTRLGGNTTTDSVGQDISFNSDESVRLLAGTRLNLAQNKKTGVYLGAALDYEFRGRTNAYINGYKADSADLKGLTGIFELGLSSKQSKTLTIDCGLQGYVGKKKGLGGTLTISKKF